MIILDLWSRPHPLGLDLLPKFVKGEKGEKGQISGRWDGLDV